VQVLDSHNTFLVERSGIGRRVEVEVSTKDFIRTFTGQDHLDTDGLDFSGQETHRNGGSYGGDIVGFQVVDDFVNRIETCDSTRKLVGTPIKFGDTATYPLLM
jgi:hypothetical protein